MKLEHRLRNPDLLAILGCFGAFLGGVAVLIERHAHFGYQDWDLALFSQFLWNLAHGQNVSSLQGFSILGGHSNFILFLILPLFKFFPHPLTLEIVQAAALCAAALMIYRIAADKLGSRMGWLFAFLYLIFPPNVYTFLYDFNPESLSPPFLLGMFYCYRHKKLKGFLTLAALTVLIKENLTLVVAAFGFFALFAKDRSRLKWGLVPLIAGAAAFFWFVLAVIPHFLGEPRHAFLTRYHHLGNSIPEVLMNLFLHPGRMAQTLAAGRTLRFLIELFGPLLPLSLLSAQFLVPAVPIFLQRLLSLWASEQSIRFFYAAPLVPFAFISAIQTASRLFSRWPAWRGNTLMSLLGLAVLFTTVGDFPVYLRKLSVNADDLTAYRWEMIQHIPAGAGVVATFGFLPELSRRHSLHSFHRFLPPADGDLQYSESLHRPPGGRAPADVQFALIDFRDRKVLSDLYQHPPEFAAAMRDFFAAQDFRVALAAGEIVLFQRDVAGGLPLLEPYLPEKDFAGREIFIDNTFGLLAAGQGGVAFPGTIPLSFHWVSHQRTVTPYGIVLTLEKDGKALLVCEHLIGYAVHPTNSWEAGEFLTERFWLPVRGLPGGAYGLCISFVDYAKGQPAPVAGDVLGPRQFQIGRIIIK